MVKTNVRSFEIVEIDRMLDVGGNYRRMNLRKAHQYLVEMEAGRWVEPHPQPVILGPDGTVIDGQHRLWAAREYCRRTRRKVKFLVATVTAAMSAEVSVTADTGLPRSIADYLRHVGAKNVTTAAALLRVMALMPASGEFGAHLFEGACAAASVSQMAALYTAHRAEVDIAAHTGVLMRHRLGTGAVPLGVLALYAARIDAEKTAQFFAQLGEGADLPYGSPVLKLRSYIQGLRSTGTQRTVVRRSIIMAVVIKAWNAWARGLAIERLGWTVNGPRAEAFPQLAVPDDSLF